MEVLGKSIQGPFAFLAKIFLTDILSLVNVHGQKVIWIVHLPLMQSIHHRSTAEYSEDLPTHEAL